MRVDEFIYTAENLMDDSSVSIFQNFENNQIFTYEGLRYSNPLSEIRELFVTWTPSRQILDFSSEWKVFRSGAWLLTRFKAVWYGQTNHYPPTTIYLLKVITVTSEKPCFDYLRRCCVDFEQPNTCWESATYFFIALIKQALIIHRILYSFCEICNITKRKSIRMACIEFYLSLRSSI